MKKTVALQQALADLKTFDKAYGLPDPPKFTIIQPAGKVPPRE